MTPAAYATTKRIVSNLKCTFYPLPNYSAPLFPVRTKPKLHRTKVIQMLLNYYRSLSQNQKYNHIKYEFWERKKVIGLKVHFWEPTLKSTQKRIRAYITGLGLGAGTITIDQSFISQFKQKSRKYLKFTRKIRQLKQL